MSTSPALTWSPSATLIAATLAGSSGWMILVLPWVTILPGAVAMMSISPIQDQATAKTAMAMMVRPKSLPIGEAGVSMISRAAGRKSRSSRLRRGKAITFAVLSLGGIDAPGDGDWHHGWPLQGMYGGN